MASQKTLSLVWHSFYLHTIQSSTKDLNNQSAHDSSPSGKWKVLGWSVSLFAGAQLSHLIIHVRSNLVTHFKAIMMSTTEDEGPTMVEKGEGSLPSLADGTSNRSLASIPTNDSMDDIPVDTPGPLRELSVRSGVADLPTAEEVRNDPGHTPGGWWTKKKIMIVSGVIIVLLAIIIGVSVGVSNKNKNEETPSSAAISDEAQRVRLSSVASFLIDEGISFEDAVTTAGSPQNRAASFMAIEDVAQLEVPLSKADPLAFKFIQRYALATFYYAFGGESWDFSMNFLRS